jgi:hypothetical protein
VEITRNLVRPIARRPIHVERRPSRHTATGKVLVLKLADTAKNGPPVANADTERVVIGNSVLIPVTANDVDPEHDPIRP